MTYGFKPTPLPQTGDKVVATALDGVVYTENNRLHVKTNSRHYVYKFDGNPAGWYTRNIKTSDDFYIGAGASPTVSLESLQIKDPDAWSAILQPDNPEPPPDEV